jgi:hypothetical protein
VVREIIRHPLEDDESLAGREFLQAPGNIGQVDPWIDLDERVHVLGGGRVVPRPGEGLKLVCMRGRVQGDCSGKHGARDADPCDRLLERLAPLIHVRLLRGQHRRPEVRSMDVGQERSIPQAKRQGDSAA